MLHLNVVKDYEALEFELDSMSFSFVYVVSYA